MSKKCKHENRKWTGYGTWFDNASTPVPVTWYRCLDCKEEFMEFD